MADTLAPTVTDEERAAAAAFDAVIGDEAPAPVRAPKAEPVQETTEAAQVAQERDYEAEARAMGWKPADEWSGDPTKHRDAKTFVELADNDPAILRQKYTEAQKQNEEFQRKIVAATNAEIARTKRDIEAKHNAQIAELQAERDRLLEQYAGNPQAIKQIVDNHAVEVSNVRTEAQIMEEVVKVQAEWPRTTLAKTDPEFGAAAFAICEELKVKGIPMADQLKEVDRRLSKRWPEYYTDAPAPTPTPAVVDTGAPPANARSIEGARMVQPKADRGFDGLPAEAKNIYKMLQNDGVKRSKEDFAKDYYNG